MNACNNTICVVKYSVLKRQLHISLNSRMTESFQWDQMRCNLCDSIYFMKILISLVWFSQSRPHSESRIMPLLYSPTLLVLSTYYRRMLFRQLIRTMCFIVSVTSRAKGDYCWWLCDSTWLDLMLHTSHDML